MPMARQDQGARAAARGSRHAQPASAPKPGRSGPGRPPARLDVVKAAKLPGWPVGPVALPCDHAGLLLLFPAMAELGLPGLVRAAGYPSTRQLSSWQSVGSLLLAKCARKARIHHAGAVEGLRRVTAEAAAGAGDQDCL